MCVCELIQKFFTWADKQVKTFRWFDISLIKLSVALITLLFAKWFPVLLSLDWYWYLILAILAALRPWHQVFFAKSPVKRALVKKKKK